MSGEAIKTDLEADLTITAAHVVDGVVGGVSDEAAFDKETAFDEEAALGGGAAFDGGIAFDEEAAFDEGIGEAGAI